MPTLAESQIFPKDLSALHRQMNKSLMVAWINQDLINRAQNDVDRSIILYDADKDFAFATRVELDEDTWQMLIERTPIRYWSKGVK